jgi:hypothetical protein
MKHPPGGAVIDTVTDARGCASGPVAQDRAGLEESEHAAGAEVPSRRVCISEGSGLDLDRETRRARSVTVPIQGRWRPPSTQPDLQAVRVAADVRVNHVPS